MPAPNTLADFWRQVEKTDGCWIWRGAFGNRYGRFGFNGRKFAAHRFAYELQHGSVESGLNVLHRCDNPSCVRHDHLFLGTHTDNMHDMFSKGRRKILRGSSQAAAKLTEEIVKKIRADYAMGMTQKQIAASVGIDQTGISRIILRKSWRHV